MMWYDDDYKKWADEGCPINAEVVGLEVSNSKIKSLEPIKNLINLKSLFCNSNKIKSLEPLQDLIKLKRLDCLDNDIQSLEPIKNLINL